MTRFGSRVGGVDVIVSCALLPLKRWSDALICQHHYLKSYGSVYILQFHPEEAFGPRSHIFRY